MSTDYRPLTPIYFTDLFDGRLESAGVHEPPTEDRSSRERCLTDGRNFLWVFCDDKGLASFTRRGWNAPDRILRVIAEKFDVDIVSEYEPEYWGYETEEEWHAAWEAMGEKDVQDFYDEVVKFVRGESHNIEPGTIGMTQAEIAKRLAAESPDLLAKDKRSDLIKAVNMIHDRDHTIAVTLTEERRAFIRMIATHEDDLPQA